MFVYVCVCVCVCMWLCMTHSTHTRDAFEVAAIRYYVCLYICMCVHDFLLRLLPFVTMCAYTVICVCMTCF